jgi:lysophospholipase L1-like esterase
MHKPHQKKLLTIRLRYREIVSPERRNNGYPAFGIHYHPTPSFPPCLNSHSMIASFHRQASYHMKKISRLTLSLLSVFVANAAELESTTPIAAKTNTEAWWNSNCDRIDTDIKKMNGKIDVAFVGDSITARWRVEELWNKHWSSFQTVNMGIGGDQTQHVLWRLQNGDLEGYKAKVFVVMIGTNNLWSKTSEPADAAAGVKAVLDLIQSKQPQAKILLMSLLPVGEKPNPGREKRLAVNPLIKKLAGGSIEYIDIYDKYIQADGSISKEVMHDFLHLSPKGYDIWAESISEKIKTIIKAK